MVRWYLCIPFLPYSIDKINFILGVTSCHGHSFNSSFKLPGYFPSYSVLHPGRVHRGIALIPSSELYHDLKTIRTPGCSMAFTDFFRQLSLMGKFGFI